MYVAMFSFRYDGRPLLRGEVIKELAAVRNDQLLTDLNYFRELSSSDCKRIRHCEDCSKDFVNDASLYAHRRRKLCGASADEISDKSQMRDRDVIANLPEARRKEIKDLA